MENINPNEGFSKYSAVAQNISYIKCTGEITEYRQCGDNNKPIGEVIKMEAQSCFEFGTKGYSIKVKVSETNLGIYFSIAVTGIVICGCLLCIFGGCLSGLYYFGYRRANRNAYVDD